MYNVKLSELIVTLTEYVNTNGDAEIELATHIGPFEHGIFPIPCTYMYANVGDEIDHVVDIVHPDYEDEFRNSLN